MSIDPETTASAFNQLGDSLLRERTDGYGRVRSGADNRLSEIHRRADNKIALLARRATLDFGGVTLPAELANLTRTAYEDITFDCAALLRSSVKATGHTSDITSGITLTSILPGERSARVGNVDGVGKPIKVVIQNTDNELDVDVDDDDDAFTLITIDHGDGVATLGEVVDAINEHYQAKLFVSAALTVEDTEDTEVDADETFYVASGVQRANQAGERLPSSSVPSAGMMFEFKVGGVVCAGIASEGNTITEVTNSSFTASFDLSEYEDDFVRFELRVDGVLILDVHLPIYDASSDARNLPYQLDTSVAAESGDTRDLTLTVKDMDGTTVAAARTLLVEVFNSDMTDSDPTADWKLTGVTGTVVGGTNKNRMLITTNASGVAVVRITDMTPAAHSCLVVAQGVNTATGQHPIGNTQLSVSFAA